ncbi:DUF4865 family protein [Paraburkholderia edwinii]|uniref:DUF4865 family protein n=1 Tax=Paraburkholderia edwinii TaxID=2861782 RepID=A0ABX8UGR8_9BURK|nr:DUF4865 family protein [Paraburkholderia edwinii]QYD68091.1 DUF4865 family protein [Paraburkholderia edwinii]
MFIMQYSIALPAEYDMQAIRARVASKGPAFDTLDGLGLKCFLIRERGRFGAQSNEYAPAYLWPHIDSMWGFLAGAGFAGIKESFGTPPVETWPALAYARSARLTNPRAIVALTREDETLGTDANLVERRERETDAALDAVERTPGLLARAVGLDPSNWRLVRFDYWVLPQQELPTQSRSYEVLHVSAPAFAELHA